MNSKLGHFWGLVIPLLGVAVLATPPVSGRTEQECFRANLEDSPSWISSAAWVGKRSEIIVVDPLRNKLLLYATDGTAKKFPDPRIAHAKYPSSITRHGDGFLLQMVENSFLYLDGDLSVTKERKLLNESKGIKGTVGSLYDWTVTGNDLIAYGSVDPVDPQEDFQLGFFRTPLNSPSAIDLLKPYEDGDYYVLGFPYLASTADHGYFLLMDAGEPAIYEISRKVDYSRKLSAFPPGYRNAPKLQSDMSGPSSAEALFKEIEGLTIPVGLYGHQGMLYVLTRRPLTEDRIEWRLFQINPREDKVSGSVVLPTSSNARHLTIVPSKDMFFIFEKGSVGAFGQQKISTMLALPSSWIVNFSMPKNVSCPTLGR